MKAAPFAEMTLGAINSADPTKPTVKPVPYTGVQFVAIPEFQGIGTDVGQTLGRSRGNDDRRSGARQGSSFDRDRYEEGRLHQVS